MNAIILSFLILIYPTSFVLEAETTTDCIYRVVHIENYYNTTNIFIESSENTDCVGLEIIRTSQVNIPNQDVVNLWVDGKYIQSQQVTHRLRIPIF